MELPAGSPTTAYTTSGFAAVTASLLLPIWSELAKPLARFTQVTPSSVDSFGLLPRPVLLCLMQYTEFGSPGFHTAS